MKIDLEKLGLDFTPRDYQLNIAKSIVTAIESGHTQILLQLAGGAGKTKIARTVFAIVKERFEDALKCVFTTPRINLAKQTYEEDKENFGLIQGVNRMNLDKSVVVANLQTYSRDNTIIDTPDIILHDEVHMHTAQCLSCAKGAIRIGFSATPYTARGTALAGWDKAHVIEHPYDEWWLIEQGFLTPMVYNLVKNIDTSDMEMGANDFTKEAQAELVKSGKFGNIALQLQREFDKRGLKLGETSMLVTAQNIEHVELIKKDFDALGITTATIHSKNKASEDRIALANFKSGLVKIAIAVDKISTGTDISQIEHVVLARAFGSASAYRQTVYRGDRLSEGKEVFYVWDFGGNWGRFKNPFDHPNYKETSRVNPCPKCDRGELKKTGEVIDGDNVYRCSVCGHEILKKKPVKNPKACECGCTKRDKVMTRKKDGSIVLSCPDCGTEIQTIDIAETTIETVFGFDANAVNRILDNFARNDKPTLTALKALVEYGSQKQRDYLLEAITQRRNKPRVFIDTVIAKAVIAGNKMLKEREV